VQKRFQGAEQHGDVLILDGLIEDFKRLSLSPNELDWKESAEAMKNRILQAFGVSPYIIGSSEPGSRAASSVAEKHLIAGVVNPLIRCMSESMTESLGPMFEDGLKVWIEPAVADDAEMEQQRMSLAVMSGVVRANELRKFAGLPEDSWFADRIVNEQGAGGGIEAGIRSLARNELGVMGADLLLEQIGIGRNGTA
jgi:phage portal protein BeeE